jgi:glutaredoxin
MIAGSTAAITAISMQSFFEKNSLCVKVPRFGMALALAATILVIARHVSGTGYVEAMPQKTAEAPALVGRVLDVRSSLLIYTNASCGYCTLAKQALVSASVSFVEVEVDRLRKSFPDLSGAAIAVPILVVTDDKGRIVVEEHGWPGDAVRQENMIGELRKALRGESR